MKKTKSKKCIVCGISLVIGKNWCKSRQKKHIYICRKCFAERTYKRLQKLKKKDLFKYRIVSFRSVYKAPYLDAEDIRDLFKKQSGCCAICGEKLIDTMQLDHIIPLSRGGATIVENLQWLCEMCNRGKFSWVQEEYIKHCKKVAEFNRR